MSEAKTQTVAAPKEKRYIINVTLGNDNEPKKIFVGANGRDFHIQRGKDVSVPKAVLDVLDAAVLGVPELDEEDPTNTVIHERKRFPYSVVGVVS